MLNVLIISSASIHTWRYINGIAPHVDKLILATNAAVPVDYVHPKISHVEIVDFRFGAWRTRQQLKHLIQKMQPALVHVHQANSVAWHARRALKGSTIPWMLTVWGSDVLLLPQKHYGMKKMVTANLLAANLVTCDALQVAAVIRKMAPAVRRLNVLNFGVSALPDKVDNYQRPWNVLSCRLHKPLYRIDRIIQAWAEIEADPHYQTWCLTVAAEGEMTDALKAQVRKLGLQRVQFTGFVNQTTLMQLYANARVMLSIPASDASSISLLEAMAYGCFPLVSNLPANQEWVLDSINGAVIEDIAQLGTSLKIWLKQVEDNAYLAKVGKINRQLIQQKALFQDNMSRFAQLYQQLISPA